MIDKHLLNCAVECNLERLQTGHQVSSATKLPIFMEYYLRTYPTTTLHNNSSRLGCHMAFTVHNDF